MAAGSSRSFRRSVSAFVEGESLSGRSIGHRKSIVGALWNYLTPRRQGSVDLSADRLGHVQSSGEETDRGVEGGGSGGQQEEPWLQAYYNGVTLVVLLVSGYLCWAVYCVLEPFLHPLLWAVLTGLLLHPFKKTWTERISQWLDLLENNSIPLSAGLFLSPLFLFNHISKTLESTVVAYWPPMLGSAVATISLWLLYQLSLPLHVYHSLAALHSFLLSLEGTLTRSYKLLLPTVFLGFIVLFLVGRSSVRCFTAITILSTLVWFLSLLYLSAYVLGSALALPLVIGLFLVGGVASFTVNLKRLLGGCKKSMNSAVLREKVGEGDEEGGGGGVKRARREGTEESVSLVEVKCSGDTNETGEGRGGGGERERNMAATGVQNTDEGFSLERNESMFEGPSDAAEPTKSHVSFGSVVRISPERPACEGEAERWPMRRSRRSPSPRKDSTASEGNEEGYSQSYYIFLGLYSMFFVVVLWTYPFLLVLLVPFAAWGALKRVVFVSINGRTLATGASSFAGKVAELVHNHRSLLIPAPLPSLSRLFLSLDRSVLKFAKGSMDSLTSLVIIVGLLVSGLALTVFLVLQIQVELWHYVTIMGAVWERALESSPQLAEWIGGEGGGGIHDTFDSVATQMYTHGREWLAGQVQAVLGDTSDSGGSVILKKQVLNLYDQLYQSYVLSNYSTPTSAAGTHIIGAGLTNIGDLLNEIMIIAMENLETIFSVLKSMWAILAENLSLVLSLLYSVLGLLLSGGTALINAVVFLTTLFYLLCYSSDVYLPVKVVLDIIPSVTQSDTAGQYTTSFSRAIRSVFHASFSRLVFYGLYTWLVHTAFGLPVSILPAVLAAIAGALPFVGTYWISLPAVLELWLVEGQTLSAITVLLLSLLPLFFVDYIIYGEVEGGHPYLTGLAVAGGVYFAGLEGALIGPILLCCLVFIHELFDDLS